MEIRRITFIDSGIDAWAKARTPSANSNRFDINAVGSTRSLLSISIAGFILPHREPMIFNSFTTTVDKSSFVDS